MRPNGALLVKRHGVLDAGGVEAGGGGVVGADEGAGGVEQREAGALRGHVARCEAVREGDLLLSAERPPRRLHLRVGRVGVRHAGVVDGPR